MATEIQFVNYLYLLGNDEGEPVADFLVPYNTYLKEQKKKYKNNPYNAKNWTYVEEDDWFNCPNGRRVMFKTALVKSRWTE